MRFREHFRGVEALEHGFDGQMVDELQLFLGLGAFLLAIFRVCGVACKGRSLVLHQREQLFVDELGQMQHGSLSASDEAQEFLLVQRGRRRAEHGRQAFPFSSVPAPCDAEDALFKPACGGAPVAHESLHLLSVEEGYEFLLAGKAARHPYEVDEPAPVGRMEKQPDAHGDVHDGRCRKEFVCG